MTLDEFRLQLLKAIQGCQNPGDVRVLLTEAHLTLLGSKIEEIAQRKLWEALNTDLALLSQPPELQQADHPGGFQDVLAAALVEVARYRRTIASL
jgi:hypothetical protein